MKLDGNYRQAKPNDYDYAHLLVEEVEMFFRIKSLFAAQRTNRIATARFVTWYLLRANTGLSFPEIGDFFGKNHSTILYGVRRVQADSTLQSYAESVSRRMEVAV